jgi:hypothetical protein
MNSKHHVRCSAMIWATLAALALALPCVGFAQAKKPTKAPERIGVYDSRSVAVAYAGSAAQERELRELKAAHQKAKAAGDRQEVARLEAEGQAMQKKAHQQAFSTAPVDDLLAHITNSLPDIQKAAGVTALISKWNQAELKKHAGAETVDVTPQLIDAFHPNDRQRERALEIQQHKPVSLKHAGRIKD